MIDIRAVFQQHDDKFLQFENIADSERFSNRADLHAFVLLDKLVPDEKDMVAAAEHDEIWLSVTPDELASVATEAQVIDLIRSGVRYDDDTDSLALFV
jgi:hypothetical protein